MLTPGIMLRLDENSAIKMVASKLADTRLEFVSGAGALDSRNAAPGEPLTITYKDYRMRFARAGRYRMDSEPAQLRVEEGEAEVACHGKSVVVKATEALPLNAKLMAHMEDHPIGDPLDHWADERSARISADNSSAVDSDNFSSALNDPQNSSLDPGTGYYGGGLTPDPYSTGSYGGLNAPYSMYGFNPLFIHRNVPIVVPYGAYRPLPIRTGVFGILVRTFSPSRTFSTPSPATSSPTTPTHTIARPLIHR